MTHNDPDDVVASETVEQLHPPTRVDTALYVLRHHRRRDALRYLQAADRPVSIDELVDYLTAQTRRRQVDPRSNLRRVVAVDVRHTHVPKLQRTPIVDRTGDRLTYVPNSPLTDLVETLLVAMAPYEHADGAR